MSTSVPLANCSIRRPEKSPIQLTGVVWQNSWTNSSGWRAHFATHAKTFPRDSVAEINDPECRGCAPGRIRTSDLRIRNPLLYPAELRAHFIGEVAPNKRFYLHFSR